MRAVASVHHDLKARITFALLNDEVEKIPLRHECQEFALCRKVGEIGDLDRLLANLASQLAHLLMRALQELLQQAKLVHQLQSGGVDRIATKIAQEVSVLLEHNDIHVRASQQKPEHHSGRPSADDAASGLDRCVHGHLVSCA